MHITYIIGYYVYYFRSWITSCAYLHVSKDIILISPLQASDVLEYRFYVRVPARGKFIPK